MTKIGFIGLGVMGRPMALSESCRGQAGGVRSCIAITDLPAVTKMWQRKT